MLGTAAGNLITGHGTMLCNPDDALVLLRLHVCQPRVLAQATNTVWQMATTLLCHFTFMLGGNQTSHARILVEPQCSSLPRPIAWGSIVTVQAHLDSHKRSTAAAARSEPLWYNAPVRQPARDCTVHGSKGVSSPTRPQIRRGCLVFASNALNHAWPAPVWPPEDRSRWR